METLAKFCLRISLWLVVAQFVSSQNIESHDVDKISPSGNDQQLRLALFKVLAMDFSHRNPTFPTNLTSVAEKVAYLANLEEHSTILEKGYDAVKEADISKWKDNEAPLISKSKSSPDFERVEESIDKTLKFFETHKDDMEEGDAALALTWAKIYDDKHGGKWQRKYALDEWSSEICSQQNHPILNTACRVVREDLKLRESPRFPESILKENRKFLKEEVVGNEKDTIHGKLNGICQADLLLRCAVSGECEAKYFGEPQSQYMLSHQLLQRIFTESSNCSSAKQHLNEDVNHRLCAKMYMEAQLVSHLGFPESLRDIFAEYVGFCGYMGYPNFFRSDWLQNILSWQSKSEYGCFVREEGFDERYLTTDTPLKRKQTQKELDEGVTTEELCRPHFTSVNLMALMGYWDYMQEK